MNKSYGFSCEKLNRGVFIAFEGIDGSGKSTQMSILKNRLKEMGIPCHTTMEPTDSPIGSLIHNIMTGRIKTDSKVIAALFVADRLDHLLNEVNGMYHKVNKGITVITDRYYFSSYAYNTIDLPMDWVIEANRQSSDIMKPDVTIFLDVDPNVALDRIKKDRIDMELFEKKSMLVKVRKNYFDAFEKLKDEENIIIINGEDSIDSIAEEIWQNINIYYER